MLHRLIRYGVFLILPLGIGLSAWLFLNGSTEQSSQTLALTAPVFVQSARAEGDVTLAGIVDEAGIAGYFQAIGPITINSDLRGAFRTIEAETSTYIVGSVAIPNYPESYDVHAYVHTEGWIMTYYLKDDPAAKIIDWKHYSASNKSSIQTVLESAASVVAGAAGKPFPGLAYYNFRWPDANRMMLIAEDGANGTSFTVMLPSGFAFYERSWSLYGLDFYLDGVRIWDGNCCNNLYTGYIEASQFLPGVTHTIQITQYSGDAGGLALVYKEP